MFNANDCQLTTKEGRWNKRSFPLIFYFLFGIEDTKQDKKNTEGGKLEVEANSEFYRMAGSPNGLYFRNTCILR